MKRYITLLMISLSIGFTSCDDFLDKTPHDAPTRDAFWKTQADVVAGTNGAYWYFRDILMYGQGSRIITYGDQPIGLWVTPSWINENPSVGNLQWFFNDESYASWASYYKILNIANTVLEYTHQIPLSEFGENSVTAEKNRNTYMGEAYFIRAYTYFFMVRLWGSVPYVTKAVSDAADAVRNIPMETEDNILNYCLDDLKIAHSYLTFDDTHGVKASRANRGAVLALKAHILMWKNRQNKTSIDDQNYRDAIAAIEEIETSQKYELQGINNYLNIWNNGGKSQETIFEFPYSRGNGEKFDKGSIFSNLLGYPHHTDRINRSAYVYSSEFRNLIDRYTIQGDQRREITWNRWGEQYMEYTIKYSSITYLDTDKLNWETDNTFVLFRLSDMYLLKAEAYEKLKDYPNARKYLKKVQERAGIPASVADGIADNMLANEICEERMRELFLEGHNFYDWVRSGQYVGRNGYNSEKYRQEAYLWPVCSTILIDNEYARQTPYWSDKMQ